MEEYPRRHAIVYVDKTGDIGQVQNFLNTIADSYETAHRLFELPEQLLPEKMHHLTGTDFENVSYLPSEHLHVASISCSSPGFWEFIGSLNPLKFITDLIEAIIRWKESNHSVQLDMARFQYESVSAYMDLLDRYDTMMSKYGVKLPRHRRIIQEQVEKMIQQLEQNVMPFSSKKKPPRLMGPSEKPKEYLTVDILKEKESQSLTGSVLSVLHPANEKFRDVQLLSFLVKNKDKMTREEFVDQVNYMIDRDFVIYDKENHRIEPTKAGMSFYESLSKTVKDSK